MPARVRSAARHLAVEPSSRVLELQPDQELEMHRTATIDYVVMIEGTMNLVLDDTEIVLRPGDCLVQRGTNHAWRNTGDGLCRFAAVLVDATG